MSESIGDIMEESTPPKQNTPSYYVAIGTSAGGLEALQVFAQHMPADSGVAFIVIQHLSPEFKSVMDELLARQTQMPVHNATDGVTVLANTIYLIPPKKHMMIAEGKLILVDQMPENGLNFPVDIFFRSLAEDQHHRSIGVILSGTGSDGSRGIQAIKEVGGMVLVQDPADAKFDGMPYSAVKSGFADMTCSAAEIPSKIIQYITHPMVSGQDDSLTKRVEDNENALTEIYQLLRERSDIDFSQYKSSTIARRIERRICINGLNSLAEYYSLLLKNSNEIQVLAKDMLIGVTRFFRDDQVFKRMEEDVIPKIVENSGNDEQIRVWIAGCSTGEEAYSIAILFDEALRKRHITRSVKIFATDVDPDAISEASLGQFDLNIRADVSDDRLKHYFKTNDEHLIISPDIRQMVVFATHNLIKDPPFSNTHLAVCRNVLIYFQPAAQRRILAMLHFSIQKHGFLLLGASETLGEIQNYFDPIDERARIFKKTVTTRIVPTNVPPVRPGADKNSPPSVEHLMRSYHQAARPAQFQPVLEFLIDRHVPACIILSETLEVLHVYGEVDDFTRKLRSGRFSSQIKDFIIDELSIAVSTAIHKAQQDLKSVKYQDVRFTNGEGKARSIQLQIEYIKPTSISQTFYAVMFLSNHSKEEPEGETSIIPFDPKDQSQQRIADLESQLQKNQEHLQVTIEELETTNEELQASNEELLAANEELQSTNEELQSVNEELYTVNSEYQEKIEEISQVNTDLENIINYANIGLIFLDDAMLIRRYSPAATEFINLLSSDIGRPFHHISHSLHYPDLLNDISTVIEQGRQIEKEVESKNSKVLIGLSPYLDEFKISCGCIVALTSLNEVMRLRAKLLASHSELRSTVRTSYWSDTEQIRVLVVDDNDLDAKTMANAIKRATDTQLKVKIELTNSAEQALQLLNTEAFDLCVLDHQLNDKNAFDVLDKFEKHNLDTAFIMMSGHVDDELAQRALAVGVYDIIDKSEITPALMKRCIRYTLRHKQTDKYLAEQESN